MSPELLKVFKINILKISLMFIKIIYLIMNYNCEMFMLFDKVKFRIKID